MQETGRYGAETFQNFTSEQRAQMKSHSGGTYSRASSSNTDPSGQGFSSLFDDLGIGDDADIEEAFGITKPKNKSQLGSVSAPKPATPTKKMAGFGNGYGTSSGSTNPNAGKKADDEEWGEGWD